MKQKLLNEIGDKTYMKFSTCDAPNWDISRHHECLRIVGEWPEGYHLSYTIKFGVHDWVLLKK